LKRIEAEATITLTQRLTQPGQKSTLSRQGEVMSEQSGECGDWTDWLLCVGIAVLLGANLPTRNPEKHGPRWRRKHPKAILLPVAMPKTPKKDQLSLGDTWTIFGVLLGVLFVIIIPPLYAKIPLFLAVCTGLAWLTHRSHWTVAWNPWQKWLVALLIVFICSAIAIPQFISQWRSENPTSATITAQRDEPLVDPPLIVSDAEQLPHVDLTKRALIKGAAGDAYFCRPGGGGITEVHMMLGVIDLGIPTSLGGWRLHYESPRLNQWFRHTEIDDHDVCEDRTLAFKFNRANSIYEQTDRRIEPNTKYRGWARFQVPGFVYKEVGTKDAQLTVEFSDNQGKKYTITYIGNGETNSKPFYYPGVPSPFIEPDPGVADVRWCPPEPIESIPWGFTAGYCNYEPSRAPKLTRSFPSALLLWELFTIITLKSSSKRNSLQPQDML
jgi:hypothetical protein